MISQKDAASKAIVFISEYIQKYHRGNKLSPGWCGDYLNAYEELKSEYKSCFEKAPKTEQIIIHEHKAVACFLIAIQCVDYPGEVETHKFRKEKLIAYIFPRLIKFILFEYNKDKKLPHIDLAIENDFHYPKFHYPKIVNNSKNDYETEFIKGLYFSYDRKNRDIYSLANIVSLLNEINLSYWQDINDNLASNESICK